VGEGSQEGESISPTAAPPTAAPPTAIPTSTPEPVVLGLGMGVSFGLRHTLEAAAEDGLPLPNGGALQVIGPESSFWPPTRLEAQPLDVARALAAEGEAILVQEVVFAAVVPFEAIGDEISQAELEARWRGEGVGPLLATADVLDELRAAMGESSQVEPIEEAAQLLGRLQADPTAVGILPFDALAPRFKVLAIDGRNPLSNRFDPEGYPLAIGLTMEGERAAELAEALAPALGEATNRDASRLTQLVMTGVTAMTRLTAHRMELYGYDYPARIIAEELSAADITHVSNEVPFIEGCVVNTTSGNLVMCSDYPYWEALEAIGTDIVGLSGNHVNDFGRTGALESLAYYAQLSVPVYGSGRNLEEACAPLLYEHNGNRIAFIAALAFDPEFAWATEDQPGACPYYQEQERIMTMVRELSADPEIDLVAVELQYLETYNPFPTDQQVVEFRELREAGADIVTGVQSHVPQAWEPYGGATDGDTDDDSAPGIIVYGLGNLFFDQMWSWETRTGLIARHTIYQGRLLSSEILTTVLEDYAQPRWATPEERAGILESIHGAAPARP
jgi:poly-gamma-glutamate synthesis protein (capsule biosynthesis protein)